MSVERTYWYSESIDKGYPVDDKREVRTEVSHDDPDVNLISSRLKDGQHAPALDLDLPCTLIDSSTWGHHHLLIDHPMPWWKYRILMRVLVFVGLVERKYYRHSVRRGMSMLRMPHVLKGEDRRRRRYELELDFDAE